MPALTTRFNKAELPPTPQTITRTLLGLVVLASTFLDYWSYSRQNQAEPRAYRDVLEGTAAAPEQYRIGAVRAANFLAVHGHMGLRHGMTIIDGVSALVAVFLLYSLLRKSVAYRTSAAAMQWFASATFVALVQFYLAWLIWYQRPETLPSAALLACAFWTLDHCSSESSRSANWAILGGLLLFSAIQGVVRADVAVALDSGVLLTCFIARRRESTLRRVWTATAAVIGLAISGGIQLYLMRILYPGANYGATPVVQFVLNVTDRLRLVPFAVFLTPWVWTAARIVRDRLKITNASLALLVGSAVFLLLWCVLGKIDEVRIFLPFALALTPLTVEAALGYVSGSASVPQR